MTNSGTNKKEPEIAVTIAVKSRIKSASKTMLAEAARNRDKGDHMNIGVSTVENKSRRIGGGR